MVTKKTIDQMLAMPDDKMAAMLRMVLAASGAEPSALKLDARSVKRIRAVLSALTEEDLARIGVLAERWRTGG